jgi:hypothetical protein
VVQFELTHYLGLELTSVAKERRDERWSTRGVYRLRLRKVPMSKARNATVGLRDLPRERRFAWRLQPVAGPAPIYTTNKSSSRLEQA